MLTMKKVKIGIETILWLAAVMILTCIILPAAAIFSCFGMLLSVLRIHFVSDIAKKILDSLICFVRFVTHRVRARTRELEVMKANAV